MKNVLFTLVFSVFSLATLQESFAVKQLKNTKRQDIETTKSNKELRLLKEIEVYLSNLREDHLLEEQEKQQRRTTRRMNPLPVKRKLFPEEDI